MEETSTTPTVNRQIHDLGSICAKPIRVLKSWLNTRTVRAPIANCVHYCGFRYGRNEYNPYESYIVDIVRNVSVEIARQRFIEFLRYYRPRHSGEALGLGHCLSREYPLWVFPWRKIPADISCGLRGWCDDPSECPDILTHFSKTGILLDRIEEEFLWLERALQSIKAHGYRPLRHRSFVRTLTLRRSDGREAYLLLDGNHRVAAMAALGYRSVVVRQMVEDLVLETECDEWPGVRNSVFARGDALRIFGSYFSGNFRYKTDLKPAQIITAPYSAAETDCSSCQQV